MKIRTIQQMRFSRLVSIVMIVLLCSCQEEKFDEYFEKPSLNELCQVSLGDISLKRDDSFGLLQTRVDQIPIDEGANFRLYAFPRGVTDMNRLLNTKTFTITKGLPIMDEGQGVDKLYLPYGDLDIYIVGPAKVANDREVASKNGVFALQGDDVIASKTEFKVSRNSLNIITPNALSHRMAKVQVRIKKPLQADYKSLSLESATILTQVGESPLYAFDEHGGSFTPTGEGDSKVFLRVVEVIPGEDYIATGILFPRENKRFKVEVVFGVTDKNGLNSTYSRQSTQIENLTFPAGEQTALVAYPVIPSSLMYRPVLIPWNATDEIVQSTSSLALYLDGRDAPEVINGKKSWRDKSGNGRHAVMNQEIPYNSLLQCYEFTKDASMRLSLNEYIPDYTLEIVAISEPQSGYPIIFRNDNMRSMSLHLPYTRDTNTKEPKIYFDSGFYDSGSQPSGLGRVSHMLSTDLGFYKKFHTYHFVKSHRSGKMAIYCDGELKVSEIGATVDHGKFLEGVLGDYNVKIRSVRLYKKVLDAAVIKLNHQVDLNIYKEPEDASKVAIEGLILYFDGKLPPYTDETGTYWPDRSTKLNHAQMMNPLGSVNTIMHNGTGYEFNNISQANFSAMNLSKSAGTHQAFTFEFVCRGIRKTRRSVLLAFGNITSPAISMRILEEQDSRPKILYDIPYGGANQSRFWIENQYTTWEYFGERFRVWTFIRTGTGANQRAKVYVDGKLIFSEKVNTGDCPEMENGRIGALNKQNPADDQAFFSGEFKAIRGYNRALTEDEMAANRTYDAKRYGIKFSE